MSITRVNLIDLHQHAAVDPDGLFTCVVTTHLLNSANGPNKWPFVEDGEMREALKRLRNVKPIVNSAHARLLAYATAAVECGSYYHEHVLLWMELPQSVRECISGSGLRFADCANPETGIISHETVRQALWGLAAFYLDKMHQAASKELLGECVSRAKIEYFPCLRAIQDMGLPAVAGINEKEVANG